MGSQEVEFITSMNVIIATVRNCSIDNDYMKLKRVLDLKDYVLSYISCLLVYHKIQSKKPF